LVSLVRRRIAPPPSHESNHRHFRRLALALNASLLLIPIFVVGFLLAVDPYYVVGSPSWRGFNTVRPYYEPYVLIAKPYQMWRLRPSAVVLGASAAEIAIDPRHGGWQSADVFNFALPSSNSYAIMLAFLHAQKVGAPLKQAVVNLDFFSYNINFPLALNLDERRLAEGTGADFAKYLDEVLPARRAAAHRAGLATAAPTAAPEWNEALYLAVNQDVAAAIARREFRDGREHWELAGRTERREGGAVPADWDEAGYLRIHPDVAQAMTEGRFLSGYHHYLAAGRAEGRLGGFPPKNWDEAGYLAANPGARNRVALGLFMTGFEHYGFLGRSLGLRSGFPPNNSIERLRRRWPRLDQDLFRIGDRLRLTLSVTAMREALSTVFRQGEPADFDDRGMRVWQNREKKLRQLGGSGKLFRDVLTMGGGSLWLPRPKLLHCFSNPDTGMTTFDPFRFMLRRAYAEGTDLRLFTSPVNAAVHQLFEAASLHEHYEAWLKELVRINEDEAARAERPPLPLWDFSDVNTITREPLPTDEVTPMRWYWDQGHYRRAAGDLILDRIFGYRDPGRALPDDFGVSLTVSNVDAHIARSRAKLREWAAANAELVAQILAAARNPKLPKRQAEARCW
jgi:hypothetical protein